MRTDLNLDRTTWRRDFSDREATAAPAKRACCIVTEPEEITGASANEEQLGKRRGKACHLHKTFDEWYKRSDNLDFFLFFLRKRQTLLNRSGIVAVSGGGALRDTLQSQVAVLSWCYSAG